MVWKFAHSSIEFEFSYSTKLINPAPGIFLCCSLSMPVESRLRKRKVQACFFAFLVNLLAYLQFQHLFSSAPPSSETRLRDWGTEYVKEGQEFLSELQVRYICVFKRAH
eukprot:1154211-Pelagomonas_calceolata.AAC.2